MAARTHDADERIAPYGNYFTYPILDPTAEATHVPVRFLATVALIAVAAALTALPG